MATKRQQATPLSREQFFGQHRKLRTKVLEIPGEEGPLTFQELMGYQRDDLDGRAQQIVDNGKGGTKTVTDFRNYKARAIAYSLVNPDGSRMFPNAETDDREVGEVAKLPARLIDLMFNDGVDALSALTKSAQEKQGKDSGETGGDGGPSK